MVSDEELFRRAMAEMDVRPKERGRSRKPAREDAEKSMHQWLAEMDNAAQDASDRAAFLEHMARMKTVPDKEREAEETARREAQEHFDLQRRKLRKSQKVTTDDTIDLHGLTRDEAIHRLAQFLARAFTANLRTVLVITGKGKHSPGQVGVLRNSVEDWICYQGRRFVHAYAEAPRAFGGSGAFILYIRRK